MDIELRTLVKHIYTYFRLTLQHFFFSILGNIFPKLMLKKVAKKVYNYHNLGSGVFPLGEEKTPHGSGERYNFDRMYMMVSSYDFTNKHLVDIGCNSGWFCIQSKLLGTGVTVGIDYSLKGIMGKSIIFASQFERVHNLGIKYVDADLEKVNIQKIVCKYGIKKFDVAIIFSVLHHIGEEDIEIRKKLFRSIFESVNDVIFYEDHEFWNDIYDEKGEKISLKGEGYRYGWNEDMTWQRKICAIEKYESNIFEYYKTTWRKDVLMLNEFSEVRFLGFSEKRRPVLALFK